MGISQELVASKLKDWTLSCKIQETLGLTSMEEALFKKELSALEEKGVLEREGARRGLKFRYKAPTSFSSNKNLKELEECESCEEAISETEEAQISNIAAYLQQKRHDKEQLEKQKTLPQLLSFLVKTSPNNDPCITSYTCAIKHTSEGFVVKVYAGMNTLSETFYTHDKFIKYLKTSGIVLDE